jgi:hypothetical protein
MARAVTNTLKVALVVGLASLDAPNGRGRAGRADLDPPGLQRIGDLPGQFNGDHTVVVAGRFHHHIVGQFEFALEVAGRDAPVQEGARSLQLVLGLAAGDDKEVWLRRDFKLVGREAGGGQGDPVAVVAGLFHVVGRIAAVFLTPHRAVDEVRYAVDTDHRPIEGRKVIGRSHFHLLRTSKLDLERRPEARAPP